MACGSVVDTGEPFAPTSSGSPAWSDCGDGLSCTTLTVPIDHSDADGPTLDLAVAVRPAARGADRIGVLLTNPGGPGASGVDALRSGVPLESSVLDRFDVVSWDPRGVGQSTPVECGPDLDRLLALDPRAESEDRADLDRLAPVVARDCAELSGPIIDHVATGDHVGDMEAIREALGEETISYLGLSYGTRFGLEYLRRHGDRVDTMVLDSVVAPEIALGELLRTQAGEFEMVLEDLLADDESELERIRRDAGDDALEGREGRLKPVRVDRAMVLAGYDPALADRFLDSLADAVDGDGTALDDQGLRYEQVAHFPAYLATSCADGQPPSTEAGWDALERQVVEDAPLVGAVVVNELRPCSFWSPGALGPALPTPATADSGSATVLLLNNTSDPVTPVQWARSVATELTSATLVEVDEAGHIALDGSSCARDWAGRVLTGEAPTGDPRCP